MSKYIYPLGSIVAIKNNPKTILITGYAIKDDKKDKSYEYCGYEIPLGYNPDRTFLFNNEDITFPVFIGNISIDGTKFRNEISKHYSEYDIPFLPIGSIVQTFKNDKELMIIGYVNCDISNNIIYDYVAIDDDDNPFHFDKEDIKEVIFIGCVTDDYKNYVIFINDIYKNIKDKKSIMPIIKEKIRLLEGSE